MKGAWRLEAAEDLLRKLEYDFERMRAGSGDAYAAFDFFVTADNLPEWTVPPCKELRTQSALLGVVSHLANNVKHFEATQRRHHHVEETSASYGAHFNEDWFGQNYFAAGWWGGKLSIQLAPDIATELALPQKVPAVEFADRVLKFWREKLRPT